ncbi:MAG: mechanosensitive ion channel [PVC group bacterium]|nr:mechanosensitive ion channel [PVC group bacterium]
MGDDILQKVLFQNTVLNYLICLGTFIAGVLILAIIKSIILARLKKWTKKTVTQIDDLLVKMIQRNLMPLLYFGVLYLSLQNLTLTDVVKKGVDVLGAFVVTIVAIRTLVAVANYTLLSLMSGKDKNEARERSLKGIIVVIKTLVWGGGIVFLLDNLGFNVSTVIAGLGIGGIAVALAAQAVLGDLFNFFSILFDRPFEVGDFIIIGDYLGAVEHIGIKTTRIRSLGGEQLVFSNTDLTNSRVRNYKRMEKRRVVFQLGVTYQTTSAQMKEVPGIIKSIIESIEATTFDRAHFSSYGDSSLNVEVVYYVLSPDYNIYMDIQQEINMKIMQEFEKKSIEFAYPTQTLYVNK